MMLLMAMLARKMIFIALRLYVKQLKLEEIELIN